MAFQPIHDIAEICALLGVSEAILSPGSRCAPLTLSFSRHPAIKTRVITDERSAGFVALGIAQNLGKPVVTVCTSGTAALNFAPAISEAFYQRIPLVVFTADRPPEWTDQQDGQTIRQQNIFNNHVKKNYQLPDHYNHPDVKWHIHRIISEAVNEAKEYPCGPVHINVPLREPFYPKEGEKLEYSRNLNPFQISQPDFDLVKNDWNSLQKSWLSFDEKLILIGQRDLPIQNLEEISAQIPVLGDVISNAHKVGSVISHADVFLGAVKEETSQTLQPDLLITFGKSTISKNLKLFLRKYSPKEHWHIQPAGQVAHTYQSLTRVLRTTEQNFCNRIQSWLSLEKSKQKEFYSQWQDFEKRSKNAVNNFIKSADFGEFKAVNSVFESLPKQANLHFANSMPVRLANLIGLNPENSGIKVRTNRGTSGIDGSNGTAVGDALTSDHMVVLITGDLAFFYDRNAFWHNHNLSNLRVIILNNHAGGIFGIIDGPSRLPELKEYFETEQKLNARRTAEDFDFQYYHCTTEESLKKSLTSFFQDNGKPAILEIETSNELNKEVFKSFKYQVSKTL